MSRNEVQIIISFVFYINELFIFYHKNCSIHYVSNNLMFTEHKPIYPKHLTRH